MEHPGFFERRGPLSLSEVARHVGAEVEPGVADGAVVEDVKPLDLAGPKDLSFIDNRKYVDALSRTRAGYCLVAPELRGRVPPGTAALTRRSPYHGFALALQLFYPDAMKPKAAGYAATEAGGALVHPSARIEAGAVIEPGAVVGREAAIGAGTTIAAGAVVGYRVMIGRGSYVGAGATVTHALVGDRVVLHAGVRIGQDGFGFALGPRGHIKVPQIGRVIVQDDVEIGRASCRERV